MKKILHICNHDFYLKKFLKPIVLKLDDENYEVHVACKVNNEDLSMFKRIKIHDISYPQSILSFYKLFLSFRQCFSIIKNNNYDIVISHNRIASFVGRASCFLSGNKNNIYFAHGFYFHDNQNYLSYFFSIQLERILSKITKHTLSQSLEDTKLMIKKKIYS